MCMWQMCYKHETILTNAFVQLWAPFHLSVWGGRRVAQSSVQGTCEPTVPWLLTDPAGLLHNLSRPASWATPGGGAASVASGSWMNSSSCWSHWVLSAWMSKNACQEEWVWFWQCSCWAALSGSEWPTGAAASYRTSSTWLENHVIGRGVLTYLPIDSGIHSPKAESLHLKYAKQSR